MKKETYKGVGVILLRWAGYFVIYNLLMFEFYGTIKNTERCDRRCVHRVRHNDHTCQAAADRYYFSGSQCNLADRFSGL